MSQCTTLRRYGTVPEGKFNPFTYGILSLEVDRLRYILFGNWISLALARRPMTGKLVAGIANPQLSFSYAILAFFNPEARSAV